MNNLLTYHTVSCIATQYNKDVSMTAHTRPPHPGPRIRANFLPKGLALAKAAELLGVGRPALSNLLNGNAALTPEMALRLEKAFGAYAQELLAMQSAYDEAVTREHAK